MSEKQSEAGSSDKEEQIEHLKNRLLNAEKLWEKRNPQLLKLLRKTYDLEMHRINQQKMSSIRKMAEAREMVEKYKKKRSSLLSQIRSVHIEDMESIDQEIMALKQKLEETAYAIEECQQRWTQIENFSGFSIVLPSPVAGNHVPNHVAGFVRSITSHALFANESFDDSPKNERRISGKSSVERASTQTKSKWKSSLQLTDSSIEKSPDLHENEKPVQTTTINNKSEHDSSVELYERNFANHQPYNKHRWEAHKDRLTKPPKSSSANNLIELCSTFDRLLPEKVSEKLNSKNIVERQQKQQSQNNDQTAKTPFVDKNAVVAAVGVRPAPTCRKFVRSRTQLSLNISSNSLSTVRNGGQAGPGNVADPSSSNNYHHQSSPFLVGDDFSKENSPSSSSHSSSSLKLKKTLSKFRLFKKKKS